MATTTMVKFCTQVDYIKSQRMNDKLPLKGAWLGSRDPFYILLPPMISLEWLKTVLSALILSSFLDGCL